MATVCRATQIWTQLQTMAKLAGEKIYERAKLAAELLKDGSWIEEYHGGSYDSAAKAVEDKCFPELGLAMSLDELLALIDKYPDQATWKRHGYSLRRLWAQKEEDEAPEREHKPERTRRAVKVVDFEKEVEARKTAEYKLNDLSKQVETLAEEVIRLRAENATLKGENAELKRQNTELTRALCGNKYTANAG